MSYKNLIAFHNIGNSCYLNSALQALLSCDEFRECVSISNNDKNKNSISVPFLSILEEISQKRDNPETPISNPILLKQMLSDHSSFFKGMHQQDCHECLVTILDIIHENTKTEDPEYIKILIVNNRTLKNVPLRGSTESVPLRGSTESVPLRGSTASPRRLCRTEGVLRLNDSANKHWNEIMNKSGLSFTSYLFSGQLRSNLVCQNCNNERDNFETINNLSLSLPDVKSLDIIDSFLNYFKTELLEDSNCVECDNCKIKTKTKKSLSLWRFPKILIIHLKRYTQQSNGTYTRNNCIVDFSPELIFRDKTDCKTKKIKLVYDLQCVVNHFGMTPMGGHYTTSVKYKGEKYDWVHIDDSNIYKSSEEDLVTAAAYILIYKLRN